MTTVKTKAPRPARPARNTYSGPGVFLSDEAMKAYNLRISGVEGGFVLEPEDFMGSPEIEDHLNELADLMQLRPGEREELFRTTHRLAFISRLNTVIQNS